MVIGAKKVKMMNGMWAVKLWLRTLQFVSKILKDYSSYVLHCCKIFMLIKVLRFPGVLRLKVAHKLTWQRIVKIRRKEQNKLYDAWSEKKYIQTMVPEKISIN